MIYNFNIDIGNQIINYNFELPNQIIRNEINNIKAYKRPNRNTQQIYINNKYFLSVVSRQYDYNNIIGQEFIKLINQMYIRGVNLNKIKKTITQTINKDVKRVYVNPKLIIDSLKKMNNELYLIKARLK